MENKETSLVKSPKWVAILSSVSTGWLVFLFTTYFCVIAIVTILNSVNEHITPGPSMVATIVIAALFGITMGVIIGKGLYSWFCNRKKSTGIILLIILVLLVLGLIPQPFTYVTTC